MYTLEHVVTLNAFGPMAEDVMLFLLRSSLSRFGNPLNASSGMEVIEFPRIHNSCVRYMHVYMSVYMCIGVCVHIKR